MVDAVDRRCRAQVLARLVAGPLPARLDQHGDGVGGLALDALDPAAQLLRGPQRVDQLEVVVGQQRRERDAAASATTAPPRPRPPPIPRWPRRACSGGGAAAGHRARRRAASAIRRAAQPGRWSRARQDRRRRTGLAPTRLSARSQMPSSAPESASHITPPGTQRNVSPPGCGWMTSDTLRTSFRALDGAVSKVVGVAAFRTLPACP